MRRVILSQGIFLSSISKSSSPNSCLASRVPALEFPWRSLSAGLAGSHVILICFHHGNSKLQQLAESRQAGNQESCITGIFCKRIFPLSSYFFSSPLRFPRFHAEVEAKQQHRMLSGALPGPGQKRSGLQSFCCITLDGWRKCKQQSSGFLGNLIR